MQNCVLCVDLQLNNYQRRANQPLNTISVLVGIFLIFWNTPFKEDIDPNSTIYSDCFKSYANLPKDFASHETVNHSEWFVDLISGVHSNTIEGNWSLENPAFRLEKKQEKI